MQQRKEGTGSITLYALTIFLSAFLLFQVQPLMGKHILPWFGGTPAVWTTCLLFFQVLLLGGYAYAHWLITLKNRSLQAIIHLCLLFGTFLLLPIIPAEAWKPNGSEEPILRILELLTATVGGPYFMLTTTGPLLQAWFAVIHKGKSPYRLYALSNAGSLLGLVSYPFLFEPLLARQSQAILWSVSYALFIFSCSLCAWQILKNKALIMVPEKLAIPAGSTTGAGTAIIDGRIALASFAAPAEEGLLACNEEEIPVRGEESPPNVKNVLLWLILSAIGSIFLLSTTNQVTQNVAVVPFLWVLFLTIYLITFILAFEGNEIYRRWWCLPLFLVLSYLVARDLSGGISLSLKWQIAIYSGALFAGCLTCHGELAKRKPSPQHLTFFFLMIAAGGAVGGLLVAIGAPIVFPAYWEYHFSLIASALMVVAILYLDSSSPLYRGRQLWLWSLILIVNYFMADNLAKAWTKDMEDTALMSRNFYGVLKVEEFTDDYIGLVRRMHHGKVLHGTAYESPPWRGLPTSYYGKGTGVWLAVNNYFEQINEEPMHIGVIGLGTGTMAAFGRKNDRIRFYEIDPDVVTLSKEWFWYQGDSAATITTVPGDARISLEQELARGDIQKFDILVADAFSGDVIPIHLLTEESVAIYRRHLKEDGILALHISNSNFDLIPLARGLAESIGWEAVLVDSPDRLEDATWEATWVLITANRSFLERDEIKKAGLNLSGSKYKALRWTDDYASLIHVFKW